MQSMDFTSFRYLFTDVDDTLTTHGRLLPETYQALWDLAQAGVTIIPVTGGCAGWCDQIARTWPVAAVIGESGAFYVLRDEQNATHWHYWRNRAAHLADQLAIKEAIHDLKLPYSLTLAKDQSFRHVDVAIDYNQDVRLDPEQTRDVCDLLKARGFSVKKSSIHINVWQGEFNKCAMAKRLLREVFQLNEDEMRAQTFFIGDAPNDENMFEFFPYSAGVANIKKHLATMSHHPAMITDKEYGLGFAEMAGQWLKQIKASSNTQQARD